MSNKMNRILLTGETETGSAEVQPVRDNQPGATNCRGDSGLKLLSHFMYRNNNSELCNALKKPLCRRQSILLTVKWICPFHAEPVHVAEPVKAQNCSPSCLMSFPFFTFFTFHTFHFFCTLSADLKNSRRCSFIS